MMNILISRIGYISDSYSLGVLCAENRRNRGKPQKADCCARSEDSCIEEETARDSHENHSFEQTTARQVRARESIRSPGSAEEESPTALQEVDDRARQEAQVHPTQEGLSPSIRGFVAFHQGGQQ